LSLSTCNAYTSDGAPGKAPLKRARLRVFAACASDAGAAASAPTPAMVSVASVGDGGPRASAPIPAAGVASVRMLAEIFSGYQGDFCDSLNLDLPAGGVYFVDVDAGDSAPLDGHAFQLDFTVAHPCECGFVGDDCSTPLGDAISLLPLTGSTSLSGMLALGAAAPGSVSTLALCPTHCPCWLPSGAPCSS